MILVLSALLALLPLLGVALLWYTVPALIVENLFMTLILLTVSGLFGLDVLMELRDRGLPIPFLGKPSGGGGGKTAASGSGVVAAGPVAAGGGALKEAGVVENVSYFESRVGHPNHLVVTLRPDPKAASRMLIFHGDVRDQFPVGRKVEIQYRPDDDGFSLLERRYV